MKPCTIFLLGPPTVTLSAQPTSASAHSAHSEHSELCGEQKCVLRERTGDPLQDAWASGMEGNSMPTIGRKLGSWKRAEGLQYEWGNYVKIRIVMLDIMKLDTQEQCFECSFFLESQWEDPAANDIPPDHVHPKLPSPERWERFPFDREVAEGGEGVARFSCKAPKESGSTQHAEMCLWTPRTRIRNVHEQSDMHPGRAKDAEVWMSVFTNQLPSMGGAPREVAVVSEKQRVRAAFLQHWELGDFPWDAQDLTLEIVSDIQQEQLPGTQPGSGSSGVSTPRLDRFCSQHDHGNGPVQCDRPHSYLRLMNSKLRHKNENLASQPPLRGCFSLRDEYDLMQRVIGFEALTDERLSASRAQYPRLDLCCKLQRKPDFYLKTVVWPLLLIVLLSSLTLMLKDNSDEHLSSKLEVFLGAVSTAATYKLQCEAHVPKVGFNTHLTRLVNFFWGALGWLVFMCVFKPTVCNNITPQTAFAQQIELGCTATWSLRITVAVLSGWWCILFNDAKGRSLLAFDDILPKYDRSSLYQPSICILFLVSWYTSDSRTGAVLWTFAKDVAVLNLCYLSWCHGIWHISSWKLHGTHPIVPIALVYARFSMLDGCGGFDFLLAVTLVLANYLWGEKPPRTCLSPREMFLMPHAPDCNYSSTTSIEDGDATERFVSPLYDRHTNIDGEFNLIHHFTVSERNNNAQSQLTSSSSFSRPTHTHPTPARQSRRSASKSPARTPSTRRAHM